MSEEPEQVTNDEAVRLTYTTAQLPQPVTATDFYLKALLAEVSSLRRVFLRLERDNRRAQMQARRSK